MYFGNINGLYLLLFIIGLIILYLIKAKPKEVVIPSLMFFFEEAKVKKYNSILKKLLVRTLLFIQLLFIILLALAAANPFIEIPIDAYSLNTVVVVDISGSMLTTEQGLPRIDLNKQSLLNKVKGRVSIILAEENPIILATNISSSRAKAILTNIDAKDVPTRLDSSINLANELLGSEKGNIVVYSDFVVNPDDDIIAAKKLAEANNKRVVFVETGKKETNVGFTSLNLRRGRAEAFIRNFADNKKMVDVRLRSDNTYETKRIEIEAKSVERISFDIEPGNTVLEISPSDKLKSDDKLYLVNPYESNVDILLITNVKEENAIQSALKANPQFNLHVAYPPVVPDLADYDVVIVSDVDSNLLLPNTFRDLNKYRMGGGKVIIMAQEGMESLNVAELFNMSIGSIKNDEKDVCVDIVNRYTSKFSSHGCFTSVKKYYDVSVENGSVAVASTTDGVPIFVMEEGLFYYGIIDSYSGFKEQINYPLFWDDLVNGIIGKESLSNFNFKTGDIYASSNSTDKQILDKSGIFKFGDREIAVNMLDSEESDIFRDSIMSEEGISNDEFKRVDLEVNIDKILLIIAILVLIFELFYIKRRGDL